MPPTSVLKEEKSQSKSSKLSWYRFTNKVTLLLWNYRPISLSTSCYKISAALVEERLDKGLDAWLMKTRYGFGKSRSTSQAIFVPRRLPERAQKLDCSGTLELFGFRGKGFRQDFSNNTDRSFEKAESTVQN